MDQPSEHTRLLDSAADPSQEESRSLSHDAVKQRQGVDFPPRNIFYCAVVLLIFFLLGTGAALLLVPLNAILEANICRRLHPDLRLPDASYCEGDSRVQDELALVRGWLTTFELLPGILVALPYGMLADKYGRKPMMVLCLFGFNLYAAALAIVCWWPYAFPVRVVWVLPIFLFIGGGIAVLTSLVYSILADLVPDIYRAPAFSALGAAALVSSLFAPSLASTLMVQNPWLPFFIGQANFPIAVIVAFFLPETKGMKPADTTIRSDERDGHDHREDEEQSAQTTHSLLFQVKKSTMNFVKDVAVFAKENPRVILLALTLLTTTFGRGVQDVLLQYAKHRFDWPWHRVGYLLSYDAAVKLVLMLVVLPTVNYFMVMRWSVSTKNKDMFIVRASALFTVLGALAMALVTTKALFLTGLGVYAFGAGINLMMRSLLAQLVGEQHRSILFTSLAVVEELSSVTAGPVLALCLRASFHMEGILSGLPFLVAALLSLITLVIVLSLRI